MSGSVSRGGLIGDLGLSAAALQADEITPDQQTQQGDAAGRRPRVGWVAGALAVGHALNWLSGCVFVFPATGLAALRHTWIGLRPLLVVGAAAGLAWSVDRLRPEAWPDVAGLALGIACWGGPGRPVRAGAGTTRRDHAARAGVLAQTVGVGSFQKSGLTSLRPLSAQS